ncbi:hypothetical protein GCM10022393_39240 [Aquimarina addita]|uniref:ATP-binding protein n=1 Tax=Aquimarina addita TaxID=870485 RepID=A0ABP6UW31_9FLAO
MTILSKKSTRLIKLKKLDSAIFYANELLDKSIFIKDTFHQLKSYNKLAKYHRANNEYFKSVNFYNKSKELNLLLGDTIKAINKLRFIESIQKQLGDFNSSENTAIEALQLCDVLDDSITIKQKLSLYNHLGIVTKDQYNFSDAKNWYTNALKLSNDSLKIAAIKNNIALVDIKQEKFSSAINSLDLILKNTRFEKQSKQKARVMDNLAYAKSKLNYYEAEKELKIALEFRKKINDVKGQFASNIHLIQYYINRDQNQKALQYAKDAYEIALLTNSVISKIEVLSYLIRLEDNPKTFAIEYYKLTDSVKIARLQAKNQFAKIKYETDNLREAKIVLEKETAQKDLKLSQEASKRNFLILITSILVIGVVMIIINWRQRIKIASFNATIKTENRISKKVHDEMANDISDIKTLVKNHISSTNPAKKQLINMLNTSYISARDIATETGGIVFGDSFGKTLKNLLMQHNDDNVKIITTINGIDHVTIEEYKKNAIYRALQELMVNMNKHSQATIVTIAYKKDGKHHEIRYTDNGIGTDTVQKNRGLQNAVTRMQDIGGSFNFETSKGNGFKASLKFKA